MSVSPFYVLFGSGGSAREIVVSAANSCIWSVRSYPSWLEVSATQAMGTTTLAISALPNPTGAFRTGVVRLGERTLIVEQNGPGDDVVFRELSNGVVAPEPSASFAWNRDEPSGHVTGNIAVTLPISSPRPPPPPTVYPPHDPEPGRTSCAVPKFVGRMSPYRGCTKNDDPADDDEFALCEVPVNFRERNRSSASGDQLHFTYEWESSSGNLADLRGCEVGEELRYVPGSPPSPPFDSNFYTAATVVKKFKAGSDGFFDDEHMHGNFVTPFRSATVTATQLYWYTCPCTGTFQVVLAGPFEMCGR